MSRPLVPKAAKRRFKKLVQQLVLDLSQPVTIVQESPYFADCPNCFEAGTLIETPSGLREIQYFSPGDSVVDGYGNERIVEKTFERRVSTEFTSIKTHGNSMGVTATSNHKLPVYRNLGTSYSPILGEASEEEIGTIEKGDLVRKSIRPLPQEPLRYLEVPWKTNVFGPKKDLPPYIEVTDEFLFSLGLYLAEGCTSKGRQVQYCLNTDEIEIGHRVCKYWQGLLGVNYSLYGRTGSEKNVVFEIYSSHLADFFDRICGHGCENKRIPEQLYYRLSENQVRALLFGLFAGDGHKEKLYSSVVLPITSTELVYQAYNLLLSCGYGASLMHRDARVGKDGITRKPVTTVRYWPGGEVPRGMIRDKDAIYTVVKQVEKVTRDTVVYNLEVQVEHSYIANGFSVNNCIWDSINRQSANIFNAAFTVPVSVFVGTDQVRAISPVAFTQGRCPVCIGQGQLFTNQEICIPAMVNFFGANDRGMYQNLPAGKEGVSYLVVKTLACNYDLLARNSIFIVHNNIKCEKFQPPIVRGLGGEEAVAEVLLQTTEAGELTSGKFDSGDHPFESREEDPRRKIRGVADINVLRGRLKGQGG